MKRAASFLLALMLLLALTACGGGSSSGVTAKDGYGEGKIGDLMHSYFFDFTVNSAALQDSYESFTPAEGNQVLVVNLTVTNTFAKNVNMSKADITEGKADIEMYDIDFVLNWDGITEDDYPYSYPITTDYDTLDEFDTVSDNQLPAVYNLSNEETRTGDLVYEIPSGVTGLGIYMEEQFDDGSEEGQLGDLYAVLFTPETK